MDELKRRVLGLGQGAMCLQLAFIGVANGLFEALATGSATAEQLAARIGLDEGYVRRWCDAAQAFELLDVERGQFRLAELGHAFRPESPKTLMPFAVQAVLGAHMAERTVELMRTGERPGEGVLAERGSILPWFGPMLEASFAGLFEQQVLPNVAAYTRLAERGGLAVDLGCGNGWYLRKLAARHPSVRGLGLDGFPENVLHARRAATTEGIGDRLTFREGDIHRFDLDEPAELIAMNRALHHVWEARGDVLTRLAGMLAPRGTLVVWEPRWPDDPSTLREPKRRGMAFQNLSEHVQGNHFLRPAEIEAAMRDAGLEPETHLFAEGDEAVIVGTRPD